MPRQIGNKDERFSAFFKNFFALLERGNEGHVQTIFGEFTRQQIAHGRIGIIINDFTHLNNPNRKTDEAANWCSNKKP